MIRPLTIVSCMLAFGSGLYLYQSKHEVQLLDRTIERTVRETSGLRDQSRLLAAEWTMLNDFERLRQFSDTYLRLEPIRPAQFTSVADLATRLPAPRAEVPPHGNDEPDALPIVADATAQPVSEPAQTVVAEEILPIPPIPAPPILAAPNLATPILAVPPASLVASVVRPMDARPSDRRQNVAPLVADSQPRSAAVAPPHPVVLAASRAMPVTGPVPAPVNLPVRVPFNAPPAPTPTAYTSPGYTSPAYTSSRPAMVAASGVGTSGPYGGSLLGMARGSMPPAPRPTPVSATYNTN